MHIVAIAFGVLAACFLILFLQYRKRFYTATARDQKYAIPTIPLEAFHERFRLTATGPTTRAEVVFIGGSEAVYAGTSDRETWILSVLARDARTVFEFGTATGRTAYLMARNSPPGSRVFTITLPPGAHGSYTHEAGDHRRARATALEESVAYEFLYEGTSAASKITQLYGDSKEFDHDAYRGICDVIFVDGAHAYSYVLNDSRKAFDMLSPDGIILWHDYKRGNAVHREVIRALDDIARERPLRRLARTNLVAYRPAWESGNGVSPSHASVEAVRRVSVGRLPEASTCCGSLTDEAERPGAGSLQDRGRPRTP